jgi:hypothetical protein
MVVHPIGNETMAIDAREKILRRARVTATQKAARKQTDQYQSLYFAKHRHNASPRPNIS